jgi:hypothetical protein
MMVPELAWILGATFVVSLLSLVGVEGCVLWLEIPKLPLLLLIYHSLI